VPQGMDIGSRIESLRSELETEIELCRRLARRNYRFALLLMAITLASSGIAGIGGIFFGLSAQTTGGIALLPGITALVATMLKPQGRANWHYRKESALNALRRRLLYQLPESPSPDNVAAIANAWSALDLKMNEDWEKDFALNWSPFAKQLDLGKTDQS
jgi:hypothetical protein